MFISYVRENSDAAEQLAADLKEAGVDVWLDRERLTPGERWRDAIKTAIRKGHLFIACFSQQFASRDRTHMNEELTLAIEELRRRPADRTWFIPVVLDGCEVPDRDIGAGVSLRDLQWVDLSKRWKEGVANIAKVALREKSRSRDEPSADTSGVRASRQTLPPQRRTPLLENEASERSTQLTVEVIDVAKPVNNRLSVTTAKAIAEKLTLLGFKTLTAATNDYYYFQNRDSDPTDTVYIIHHSNSKLANQLSAFVRENIPSLPIVVLPTTDLSLRYRNGFQFSTTFVGSAAAIAYRHAT